MYLGSSRGTGTESDTRDEREPVLWSPREEWGEEVKSAQEVRGGV